MNLYFRLLCVMIAAMFRPKIASILNASRVSFRVLPTDLDMNGHMNNGRYPTIMDLGRLDLILRSGLFCMMMRQKSVPILASIKIRFRIALAPFEPYMLETRVLCWDEKWTYMEQRFIIKKGLKKGAVAAIAIVKGGFYDGKAKETLPTQNILDALNMDAESPEFPKHIVEWQKSEEFFKEVTAEGCANC